MRIRIAPPVKLLVFFLLAGTPLVALAWLGWELLEREDAARVRERLENASTLIAADLERSLSRWEGLLPDVSRREPVALPPNTLTLLFNSAGVLDRQGTRLAYLPIAPVAAEDHSHVFDVAERAEFGPGGDVKRAAATYRTLAASGHRALRGESMMRLARVLRGQHREKDALSVYDELRALDDVRVGQTPAGLLASRERMVLLTRLQDGPGASREAANLAAALAEGRFLIDRATFDFYRGSLPDPVAVSVDVPALRLAAAVEQLWPAFQREAGGRTGAVTAAGRFAAVWRRNPEGVAVIAGDVDGLFPSAPEVSRKLGVRVSFENQASASHRDLAVSPSVITRPASETGLPWTLQVALADSVPFGEGRASRRRVFGAGFGLMVAIMAAAGYFIFRSVNRELAVARLQSDFVAAVSHEFRTPLTAMCHLTEALDEGHAPPERVPQYYRALRKESRRLHGMVESLLDFRRIESGRRTYEFIDTDAAEFVTRTVQEFRDHAGDAAGRVKVCQGHRERGAWPIRADRDALAVAIRSLLDNAVKYSPSSARVTVTLELRDGYVGIGVEDEGPGIEKHEQREIFRKFTRGTAARTLNVKGTGIGLTMAAEIVRAHGGRLELRSEPGRGSRFTTLLPIRQGQA